MELVGGNTLQQPLPMEGFEPERVVEPAIPIVAALEAAQASGVRHRDLKPAT